jgi:hypothetical protein
MNFLLAFHSGARGFHPHRAPFSSTLLELWNWKKTTRALGAGPVLWERDRRTLGGVWYLAVAVLKFLVSFE